MLQVDTMKPLSSLDMLVSQLDPVLRATAKKKSGRGVSEKVRASGLYSQHSFFFVFYEWTKQLLGYLAL
jgi:hypothetical protein